MEPHEAELFSKMLDMLLKIVDTHLFLKDPSLGMLEKIRQMNEKRVPEQQPRHQIEIEEPYLEPE